ncbi:hypothetical protein CHU98_g4406 [Xylaria longipes]|nr:hypothetical protein CHU98_g4406 [Xylaria longipes]
MGTLLSIGGIDMERIEACLAKPSPAWVSSSLLFCIRHSYSWSPATAEIKYKWETFENIDFFTKSPYFGIVPTRGQDQAWDELLPKHPIGIPKSKLPELNQSVNADWVHAPGDETTILAIPEYAAQLGCLNFLRQWSYWPRDSGMYYDYSYLAAFQGGEELILERTHQCLERLRQAVMCWSDSGVVIRYTKATEEFDKKWMLDFGTYHNCRNFDRLRT